MNFALKILIVFIVIISIVALIVAIFFTPKKEVLKESPGVLFFSNDGGLTWIDPMDKETKLPVQFNVKKIVAASDNQIFLLTKEGFLLKSLDQGKNWEKLPLSGVIDFTFFKSNVSQIYYFVQARQGFSSIRSINLNTNEIKELYRPIVPAPAQRIFAIKEGEIFIFFSDGQIIKSADFGLSWQSIFTMKEPAISITYNDKFSAFFILTKNNFFRSDDGENFQDLTEYITNFESTPRKLVFQAFWANNNIYILANNQLFISKDGGYNFVRKKVVLAKTLAPIIRIAEASLSDKKTNIILSSMTQIYVSENDGASWRLIKNPSKFFISLISSDDKIPSNLYLGTAKR